MTTRYQQLRRSIARLAATADRQHAYLESILSHLTPDGDARGYGNGELEMESSDIYGAVGHLLEWNEITQPEIDAAEPLDALLQTLSQNGSDDFWQREALWDDPRWEQVRQCARQVLSQFPDEDRLSGWIWGTS